jgi:mono/diheme cytochrome c family protein
MRGLFAFIGFVAVVIGVGALVFFFGGFFNVAATNPEPELVKQALIKVRMASVDRYAIDRPPSGFDTPAQVQAGAKAYLARGCATCHGAPGVEWQKFSEGLRPDPPDLTKIVKEREPRHLFWVIKNGINMTGMPSFGATGVPDPELWSIVAFLKKLPDVSEADFKAWSAP